jgi:hypothetical protein
VHGIIIRNWELDIQYMVINIKSKMSLISYFFGREIYNNLGKPPGLRMTQKRNSLKGNNSIMMRGERNGI